MSSSASTEQHTPPPASPPNDLPQWTTYASGSNPLLNNGESSARRIHEFRGKLFSAPEVMHVDFLDFGAPGINTNNLVVTQTTINDAITLDTFLGREEKPDIRIISIHAPNTIKPLKITSSAMLSILTHHHVDPQFLDLLLSFAIGSNEAEAGPGSMVSKSNADSSCELQYRLSYVEEVKGRTESSWATRQTGVYHRYVPKGPGSLWIFLHPRHNSTLQTRLTEAAMDLTQSRNLRENLQLVNLLALSSYFGDWRWYLKHLRSESENIANVALSIDFSKEGHYKRGTDTLQKLHSLQDKVLPLAPRLRSTLTTVLSLNNYNEKLLKGGHCTALNSAMIADELQSYEVRLNGHLASVALLEKRIQEILNLVKLGVALNLQGQSTAVNINRNIWSLTKDTVDDSATVRLVTIITLVYLPASFASSFLGMNLFSFGNGSGFQISKQIWVFALVTIILIVITFGFWAKVKRDRRKQKEREISKAPQSGKQDV